MRNELTPTEALYGFVGWLTSRKDSVTFGSNQDCYEASELLQEFLKANDMPNSCTDNWPDNLVRPGELPDGVFRVE